VLILCKKKSVQKAWPEEDTSYEADNGVISLAYVFDAVWTGQPRCFPVSQSILQDRSRSRYMFINFHPLIQMLGVLLPEHGFRGIKNVIAPHASIIDTHAKTTGKTKNDQV
jgi:hypothetical protein